MSIDQAFIKQFEREVHESYQRQGSKLRNTVRTVNNVNGSSAVFQKVGVGAAATKASGAMVPLMNLDHSNVEVTLQDFYAGDWVDRMDELKTNIDERQVIANAGAHALGRKSDEMIITALSAATSHVIADGNTGLTKAKILEAFETFGANDVPDDDLALKQLRETQALKSQQQAADIELQKQNIALRAADDEKERKDALRRAVARQRASFGSSGVGVSGGSSEAVLLGLVEESEEDRASRESSDALRLQALDQNVSKKHALNLLQSTQLAERQSINNLF